MDKINKETLRKIITSVIYASSIGGILYYGLDTIDKRITPKAVYTQHVGDLNKDGLDDIILRQVDDYQIPMYAIKSGSEIIYISGEEMKKRDPNSIIDYRAIRTKLNKK